MRELLKCEGKGGRKGRRMMIVQTVTRDRNVVEERRRGNHNMKGIKEGKKQTVVFVIFEGHVPEII
jgi:hypothetical protein